MIHRYAIPAALQDAPWRGPRGIVFATVPCPRGLNSDDLLVASWRADELKRPMRRHLARARGLIDRAPERFRPAEVGLSDHDWAMFGRLGGASDFQACLVAAWMEVGVRKVKRKANLRSLWDHKLIEHRHDREAAV